MATKIIALNKWEQVLDRKLLKEDIEYVEKLEKETNKILEVKK